MSKKYLGHAALADLLGEPVPGDHRTRRTAGGQICRFCPRCRRPELAHGAFPPPLRDDRSRTLVPNSSADAAI